MKKSLVAATAMAGLWATVNSAQAADPVIDAGYDWTGAYIGLNAGANFGSNSIETELGGLFIGNPFYEEDYPAKLDNNSTGFTGGVTAGANWQHDNFVFGLEADFNYLDNHESATVDDEAGVVASSLSTDIDWFATIRPRLGLAHDNLLFYVTGGLAVGKVKSSADVITTVPVYEWNGSSSSTEIGWTVGAGAEWGVSENWTIKAEYLWVDLGSDSYDLANNPANPSQGFTMSAQSDNQFSVVRLGVNFRF